MHTNRLCCHNTSPHCRHRRTTNYFQCHTTYPYYRSREHARKPLFSSPHLPIIAYVSIIPVIDVQATNFSVRHRFPIIAHVKMHATRIYRPTTSPNCRHRRTINYVRCHTNIPYYRSRKHARKPLFSSHQFFPLSLTSL